jgi:hypothetical protein
MKAKVLLVLSVGGLCLLALVAGVTRGDWPFALGAAVGTLICAGLRIAHSKRKRP